MPHIGPDVTLDDPAYIHDTAQLYGKVYLGPGSSVWPNVVMIAGVPGKLVGSRDSGKANLFNAKFYYQNALNYSQGIERIDPAQLEALLAERDS